MSVTDIDTYADFISHHEIEDNKDSFEKFCDHMKPVWETELERISSCDHDWIDDPDEVCIQVCTKCKCGTGIHPNLGKKKEK